MVNCSRGLELVESATTLKAVATYLDKILVAHREAAANDDRPLGQLAEAAFQLPPTRDFSGALRGAHLSVIAEIKRRSPSKGDLSVTLDPIQLGVLYESSGAAALSVLTDSEFFGGSFADLKAARDAVSIPVLRKDFTVSTRDVYDARIRGADACLLIVAALSDADLGSFHALAVELGLSVLVEVHDEEEVARALGVGATIIGINQRDLRTFEVDTDRAVRVRDAIPENVIAVAESGGRTAGDALRLAQAGFDAILVGEHLVTAADTGSTLRAMAEPTVDRREGQGS